MHLCSSLRQRSALIIAAFLGFTVPAYGGFDLGGGYKFGIIDAPGSPKLTLDSGNVTGNIGIADPTGQFISTGGGTITGDLQFAGTPNYTLNTTLLVGAVHGHNSPLNVVTAWNDVVALQASLSGEAGTALTVTGNGQTVNVVTGKLDSRGDNVFTVSAFDIKNGGLTINGTANSYVVFNISATSVKFMGPITLTGGITDDHVLYNFIGGPGSQLSSDGNSAKNVVHGDILAPNYSVEFKHISILGRLFAGGNQEMVLGNDFNLTAPVHSVPEPGSLLLMGFGLVGLGFVARRRYTKSTSG